MALSPRLSRQPVEANSPGRRVRAGTGETDVMRKPSMLCKAPSTRHPLDVIGRSPSTMSKAPSVIGARKSVRLSGISDLVEQVEARSPTSVQSEDAYARAVWEARRCTAKHGSATGAFAEEWSTQLLVDCGKIQKNRDRRLMVMTPATVEPLLENEMELDRVFKFVLFNMDTVAMHEKYDFVYCHSGLNVVSPELAHRFRVAYDILPHQYAKNVHRLHILHPSVGLKVSLMAASWWMTKRLWNKIVYHDSLESLCEALHLDKDVRRRFPQLVHYVDAVQADIPPPLTFGSPLEWLCNEFGVNFLDRTTGRRYPQLPPTLICLCEALGRHDADSQFAMLFTGSASAMYDVVGRLDEGMPLDPETPLEVLWGALKLWLDCLPEPLLSFKAWTEFHARNVAVDDRESQRWLLLEFLHKRLPTDAAYVILYVASFFNNMCKNSKMRVRTTSSSFDEASHAMDHEEHCLSPLLVAQVFTPCFLSPREPTAESLRMGPMAVAVVHMLILSADEPAFWIGKALPSLTTKCQDASKGTGSDRSTAYGDECSSSSSSDADYE